MSVQCTNYIVDISINFRHGKGLPAILERALGSPVKGCQLVANSMDMVRLCMVCGTNGLVGLKTWSFEPE